MNPNEAEVPRGLRSKSQKEKAPTQEPRNPVLQPRKQKDIVMSTMNEDNSYGCNYRKRCKLTAQESEAGELSSMKIAGPKRVLMNKVQEKIDEKAAMKTGIQRNENLNVEVRQMVNTELSKVKATGIEELSSVMPVVETLKEGLTDAIATNKPKTSDSTIPLLMVKEELKAPDEVINIPSSPHEKTTPIIEHYISEKGGDLLSALCNPPGVPDTSGLTSEMLKAYAFAISAVKNGLISFLKSAKPTDVTFMITQANTAFSSLKGLYADCSSFYNVVRSYILHCSQFSAAEKELKENSQTVMLVARHEDLVRRSTEAAKAVSNIEDDLVKATKYLTPLEAHVLETRQLLDKLDRELGHRRKEVADLEAEKIRRVEALAAVDAKMKGIVVEAKKAQTTLKDIFHRRKTARAAMDETRAQLSS